MHKGAGAGSKRSTESVYDQHCFVWLREISCNFVDRVLKIGSHTIHEITLSHIKEHEYAFLCKAEAIVVTNFTALECQL